MRKSPRTKIFGFVLIVVLLVALFTFMIWKIFQQTASADIVGGEICDNRIDDNGDGKTDDCWDPGNNYQPTGRIYYVSKASNASDSNPGTEASPFKTINKATSLAQAGDGIYVAKGNYPEDVVFANAGTPSKPILLKGISGSRETVVIEKSTDWTSTGFTAIEPKSNTIIQNLTTNGKYSVTNDHGLGGVGIMLRNVENILVQNCFMTTHERPIQAEVGSRLIVRDVLSTKSEYGFTIGNSNNDGDGSEFDNTLWENVEVAEAIYRQNNDGWASEGSTTHHVFRNCKAHGWYDSGFDLKSHVLIENSLAYDNDSQGYKIWRDGVVRNSIAYDNGQNNFLFAGLKPSVPVTYNYQMVGCVSYGKPVLFEKTWETDSAITPSKVKISHNIFLNSKVADQVGNIFTYADHNLFQSSTSSDIPSVKGTSAIQVDPKFIDPTGRNFRLQSGSPAIDAGSPTISNFMAAIDYAGNNRKSGSAVDIGPYEFGGSTTYETPTNSPTATPIRSVAISVAPSIVPTVSPSPTARPSVEVLLSPIRTITSTPRPSITPIPSVTTTPPNGNNQPPIIKEILPQVVSSGSTLRFNIYATDPEGKPVSYKITYPNATVASSNAFYWRPSRSQYGTYTAKVRATDALGAFSEKAIDIKVLKSVSYFETRWLNSENTPDKPDVYFQVCRRSTYSSKYTEIITFSDGSDYLTINEPGRSACTNYYSHHYNPGAYTMTLYLCTKDSSGNPINCFPNRATVIKR